MENGIVFFANLRSGESTPARTGTIKTYCKSEHAAYDPGNLTSPFDGHDIFFH